MGDTLDLRHAVMRCAECHQRFGADAIFCPFDGARLEPSTWAGAADPLIGRVIDGRYEVTGVLGEGGMGMVYRVRHVALDRVFAMKALRRDLARDPDLSARFTREARATAMVKHPNVVAITDFGRLEGDVPYFVMEQLVGDTLSQAIKRQGPMPRATAVSIVLQVASALAAAHAARIVHRDLKPDNVFLLGKPSGEVEVRVVDFGASMILGASRTTRTGIVFGTPHYMSPEQASGQTVDHRADIYALGIILYEMLVGRVPFVADTYMGVLTQHLFVKPVPPSQVSEHACAHGALEAVLMRMLEKNPEHRYPTMDAVIADVRRVATIAPDGTPGVLVAADRHLGAPVSPAADAGSEAGETATGPMGRAVVDARRASARTWALYAAVAFGVAVVALGARRVLEHRAAGATVAPAPTVADSPGAGRPSPGAVDGSSLAAASSVVTGSRDPPVPPPTAPAPTPSARTRPVRPASKSDARKRAPANSDPEFADPWAR